MQIGEEHPILEPNSLRFRILNVIICIVECTQLLYPTSMCFQTTELYPKINSNCIKQMILTPCFMDLFRD